MTFAGAIASTLATRSLAQLLRHGELGAAGYGTYVSSSRSGSLGVEKSLELYKRTQS
jgi:hypothetical protein